MSATTILKAAHFAATKHTGQRRKHGDVPYVNHPIAVARTLAEKGGIEDETTLLAALLHDTIEDTATTYEELEREFGRPVANVVRECTDDRSLSKVARKQAQIEHGPHLSAAAKLVKLADKLDNLRELAASPPASWSEARVRGYFVWAHEVVAAIGDANEPIEDALQQLFAGRVPADADERRRALRSYYGLLADTGD